MPRSRFAPLVLATVFCATPVAWGKLAADNPDWKETNVPPPPAFNAAKLIAVEVSANSALSFGVDPATLVIAPDGVVRYVVVASSRSGAVNAMYEGVRCATGDYRVYARYNTSGGWSPVADTDWRSMYAPSPSRYTLAIAKSGVCKGNAPNLSTEHIVRDLRAGPDRKFD